MKRKPYILSISAFCLLALAACSEESLVQDIPLGSVPVGFSSNIPATKATEYTNENLQTMGVFTYFTNGNFDVATATPNFMYNQLVEKNTNENIDYPWTYNPVKFWPTNGTDLLSFFAYAPYVDGAADSNPKLSGNTAQGFPTLTYTVPAAEADQIDLLAATPQMNKKYSDNNGTVTFPLKHALTKVAVYIKSGDDIAGKKVTAFSIQSTTKGTLAFCDPATGGGTDNANANGFTWSFTDPTMETFKPTEMSWNVPLKSGSETDNPRVLLATFYLLPNTTAESTFSITYTYPGVNENTTDVQSITLENRPLPSLDSWIPGAFISYTYSVTKKKVTVTAAECSDWTYGGTSTVIGGINFEDISSSDIPDWKPGGSGVVDGEEIQDTTNRDADFADDADNTVNE
ncbi:fimbrillin family protein [Parabacteroides sp.]